MGVLAEHLIDVVWVWHTNLCVLPFRLKVDFI